MTRAEIIGQFIIGFFLIIVGAVASPLLKRMWEKMNQPSPLTPQTRGQLTQNLGIYEEQLARLNHLGKNQKDVFLYLFQLLFAALFFSVSAALVYLALIMKGPNTYLHIVGPFLFLTFADALCLFGLVGATTMSDKKLVGAKQRIQSRIDAIKEQLNSPRQDS